MDPEKSPASFDFTPTDTETKHRPKLSANKLEIHYDNEIITPIKGSEITPNSETSQNVNLKQENEAENFFFNKVASPPPIVNEPIVLEKISEQTESNEYS
jgi:hypothetical protein